MNAVPTAARPDPSLEQIGKLLDALPTLPLVALKLQELMNARRSSVQQVAELLSVDPSLSAKLLRLVNSAYFGIPGGVTDIARAVPFVGFNTIYQLVLTVSVLETLNVPGVGTFDPRHLWLHSLAVGATARVIGEEIGYADPGSLFTAGLLHDMGKIAQAKLMPERLIAVQAAMVRDGLTATAAEAQVGLLGHDRIGTELARRWRLPAALVVPIECHHTVLRPEVRERLPSHHRTATEAIAVADLIARDIVAGVDRTIGPAQEDVAAQALLDTLGVSAAARVHLYSKACAQLERSRPFLQVLDAK
ncbi:MAG: HDOD domain-containing protein [Myxococcales bacterium]|nr:HDOD domain-containing protein [Myxococcales bacterium]MBK7193216.1 HDOD domain-containing protein [Myxococcales bacterium]MBP6843513.1 HDOD domain-containing protein [Kofleriaceae bacterium]